MEHSEMYDWLAHDLELWHKATSQNGCDFVDVENDLAMAVEWSEHDTTWIWSVQAVVMDLDELQQEQLETILALNDDGLVWCYHAIRHFENDDGTPGMSLNLKYAFATPSGKWQFAASTLRTVLRNMRRCALTVSRAVL